MHNNLDELIKEAEHTESRKKIVEYFSKGEGSLESIKNLEEVALGMLESFLAKGLSISFDGDYDPEQVKKGIEVEMEHTDCKLIAEKIAKDHLSEYSDYYTRLEKIEK